MRKHLADPDFGPGQEKQEGEFCTDVTSEMRTVSYQKAFIQLMSFHTIGSSFISKWKRGQEGKIAERKRESECRLAVDVALVVKWSIRKYTCLIKKMETFGRIVIN